MGPIRSLSLIIGPSEVIVLYWAMLSSFFVQVVFWVELPIKMKLCPIFVKSWSWKKEHGGVMSGYLTSTSLSRVDGLSTDPRVLGHHKCRLYKFIGYETWGH